MSFDAGSITAELTLDRDPFQRELRAAIDEAERFAARQFTATLSLDTSRLREQAETAAREAVVGLAPAISLSINSSGLRGEVERAVNDAIAGVRPTVPLTVDSTGLRSEVDRALKDAVTGQIGQVGLSVDTSTLREQIRLAVDDATATAGRIRVEIELATVGLREKVAAAAAAAGAGQNVNIGIDIDKSPIDRAALAMSDFHMSAAPMPGLMMGIVAAVATLGPALVSAVGVLATLPGLLIGAGTAAGALMMGFHGVGDALKAMGAADTSSAATSAAASKSREASANAVIAAQERLGNAQQALAAAERTSSDQVAAAQQKVQYAEVALADAQVAEQRAQENLTSARAAAVQKLEDLERAVAHGALAEQEAILHVAEAQQREQAVNAAGSTATALQREAAHLGVLQAQQDLDDVQLRNRRNAEDLQQQQAQGIDGNRSVVSAIDGVNKAHESVGKAQDSVANANTALVRAQENGAASIVKAQQGIQDAIRALATAQEAAGTTGSAAMSKVNEAMNKLSPAGREFVNFLHGEMMPALKGIKDGAQAGLLPGVEDGLRAMIPLIPTVSAGISGMAQVMGNLVAEIGRLLGGSSSIALLKTIMDSNNVAFASFGRGIVAMIDGFLHLAAAAAPMTEWLARAFENSMKLFNSWATGGEQSGKLASGFQVVMRAAGDVMNLLIALSRMLVDLFTSPHLRDGSLSFVESLTKIVNKMDDWIKSAHGAEFIGDVVKVVGLMAAGAWDAIKGLVSGFQSLASQMGISGGSLKDFIDKHPELIRLLGAAAVGLVAVTTAGSQLAPVINGVGDAIKLMSVGPLGLIVLGIAGLALAFVAAYEKVPAFREAVDSLVGVCTNLGGPIKNLVDQVQNFVGTLVRDMGPGLSSLKSAAGDILPILGNLGTIIGILVPPFLGDLLGTVLAGAFNTLARGVQAVMDVIKTLTGFFADHKTTTEVLGGIIAVLAGIYLATLVPAMLGNLAVLVILSAAQLANNIQTVAGSVGRFALAAATTAVSVATGIWTAAQWLLNAALNANPIGIIIVVIIALVAAFVLAYQHSKTFRDIVDAVGHALMTALGAIKDAVLWVGSHLVDAWKAAERAVASAWDSIKRAVETGINAVKSAIEAVGHAVSTAWHAIWGALGPVVSTVFNIIKTIVTTYIEVYVTIIRTALGIIIAVWTTVWNAIVDVVKVVWGIITTLVHDAITVVLTVITAVGNAISAVWNAIWGAIVTFVTLEWEGIKVIVSTAWNWIKDAVVAVGTVVTSWWNTFWRDITAFVTTIWDGIKTVVNTAWNWIKDVVAAVGAVIATWWDNFWRNLTTILTNMWDGLKNIVNMAWNWIKDTISAVGSTIEGWWNAFWDRLTTGLIRIWDTLKNAVGTAWNWVKDTLATVGGVIEGWWNGFWDRISTGLSTIWTTISTTLSRVWGEIQGIFKSGANVLIGYMNTVLEKINQVADKLGFKIDLHIPTFSDGGFIPPGLAAGGTIPEYANGTGRIVQTQLGPMPGVEVGQGFRTNGPRAIVGEGNQAFPEYVIPTDPQYRERARGLYAQLGQHIGTTADYTPNRHLDLAEFRGMADGGIIYVLPTFAGGGAWAPNVAQSVGVIEANFPLVGSTYPGHQPDEAHAADFMTSPDVGSRMAPWAQQHAAELALQYIIWQQRIWNATRAGEGWRLMEDRGSPTQNHMDHVHISWPTDGSKGSGGIIGFVRSALASAYDALVSPIKKEVHSASDDPPHGGAKHLIGAGVLKGIDLGHDFFAGKDNEINAKGDASQGGTGSYTGGTPGDLGLYKAYAQQVLDSRGMGNQFPSVDYIFNHESGWDPGPGSINPSSGAYGIPQANPSGGQGHPYQLGDWQAQINWGISYMIERYHSPAGAEAFWRGHQWYDEGGLLPPGASTVINATGAAEVVFNHEQWGMIRNLAGLDHGPQALSDSLITAMRRLTSLDQPVRSETARLPVSPAYAGFGSTSSHDNGLHIGQIGIEVKVAPTNASPQDIATEVQKRIDGTFRELLRSVKAR